MDATAEERAKAAAEEQVRSNKERIRKLAEEERMQFERMQKQYEDTKKASPLKLDFKERDSLNNGSNYNVCSIRMRGFLQEAGMWDYVSGPSQDQRRSRHDIPQT